jgi:hypothetical protein
MLLDAGIWCRGMSAQIFISHSSKDESAADTIRQALENRGLACWIAGRDVNPGENFMSAIVQAIRSAKVMVLVFTENANTSQEIAKELALASQHQLVVMPVRVEDVVPNDALSYALATSQWTDLFRDWELAIERLSTRIAALVAIAPAPGEGSQASVPTGHARVAPAGNEPATTTAAGARQIERPREDAAHGGPSISPQERPPALPVTVRAVGIALVIQGVIRLLMTATTFASLPAGYLERAPSFIVQGVLLPLALAAAAIAAGTMIYRGLPSARSFGLAVSSICLLFQLYVFANGLSLISRGATNPTFLLTFWIIGPAYAIVFAAGLFYLLRWRPTPRPAKGRPREPKAEDLA